jgi:hypothetical protein
VLLNPRDLAVSGSRGDDAILFYFHLMADDPSFTPTPIICFTFRPHGLNKKVSSAPVRQGNHVRNKQTGDQGVGPFPDAGKDVTSRPLFTRSFMTFIGLMF